MYPQTPTVTLSVLNEKTGSTSNSKALEDILRVTIALAIEDLGFRAVFVQESSEVPSGAEFFLTARYSISGNRVTLRLQLVDARSIMPEASGGLDRALDPQFDREVSRLAVSVLRAAEREIAARPRLPLEQSASIAAGSPGDAVPAESPGQQLEASPPPAAEARDRARQPPRPDFGVGIYLPLGDAGDYFGAAGWFGARWGFPLDREERWSAGPSAAVAAFSMAGPDETASGNYFMMLGAELSFRVSGAGKVSPFASVSAGPALAVVRGADPARFAKLMPYAAARLGASLRIDPRWRLGIDSTLSILVDYEPGFESLSPVWGFAPKLFVSVEPR